MKGLFQTTNDDVTPLATDSSTLLSAGITTFIVLFAGFGIWMYSASIQGAIIAPGSVSVSGQPKTIQHLDGGIVADIKIKNGDIVTAGDILLSLDDTILTSALKIYESRFREAVARRDRLQAELDGKSAPAFDNSPYLVTGVVPDQEINNAQYAIFLARRASYEGQVSQLNRRIDHLGDEIDGLKRISESKSAQITILKKELSAWQSLADDGFTSKNRTFGTELSIQELQGQQFEHIADMTRVQNTIEEVRLQIAQLKTDFIQTVLTELREASVSIVDIEQQLFATRDKLKRVDIRAPIAGVVHEQNVFTIGGVIAPGAEILQIIPQNQLMEFYIEVAPQNIDQIFVDQEVQVLFSAFNTRTTPKLSGSVKNVSINTSSHEKTGLPFYPVKVMVPNAELERLNGRTLVSGMPLEAFFTTQGRSPLNYLVKPLTDNLNRAFREE